MAANSKTTTIPLGNKPFASPYYSLGQEITHNMFLELAQSENSKAQYYLLKIPGLRRFGSIPSTNLGACRGIITTTAYRTFIVNGSTLSEVLQDGSTVYIGTVNSQAGPVSMADNGSLMMLVDGNSGWILRYADNNFTRITDEYFPGNTIDTAAPTFVIYINTYFAVNIPNTNQFYWSTNFYGNDNTPDFKYDPTYVDGYWSPLQSAQKIGKSDNISAIANVNNYIWAFGYQSTEVFYDTGNFNGQLWSRYQGAVINVGCQAKNSVAVYANNVFWLGTDIAGTLGVFSNEGVAPVRVSTRGIEQMIESMGTWSDCQAFTYSQSGHNFYVMVFPTANRTLVYDTVTASWHERTKLLDSTGQLVRWDGMYATNNYDKHIFGDANTSACYALDTRYYKNDNPMDNDVNDIRCCKTTPIGFSLGQNVRYNWAQIICNQGTGTNAPETNGTGLEPTVQLAWSGDCGITYNNEQSAPIGRQGEYSKRTRVLAAGMSRNRVWRITMTDPVPFILVAILVDGSPCRF